MRLRLIDERFSSPQGCVVIDSEAGEFLVCVRKEVVRASVSSLVSARGAVLSPDSIGQWLDSARGTPVRRRAWIRFGRRTYKGTVRRVGAKSCVVRYDDGSFEAGVKRSRITYETDEAAAVSKFFAFVSERHEMWARRTRGEAWPWTTDEALRDYAFCNVYRELDRGTVYFRRRASDDVYWCSLVYRLLNKIESFSTWRDRIPTRTEWPSFKRHLFQRRRDGHAVFSSAHQTMGLDRYIATVESAPKTVSMTSPQEAYAQLRDLDNLGPFFAWQIVCDIMEASVDHDENSFVVLGPGAKKGLRRIFGKDDVDLAKRLTKRAPEIMRDFVPLGGRPLTLKNVEHCLCEYEKYHNPHRRKFKSRSSLDQSLVCAKCNDPNPKNDHQLLFCDLCNYPVHADCLPSDTIPDREWFCPACAQAWHVKTSKLKHIS
ncbi:hypothetical protein CTAYLR_004073 [Chrysophaeum taylorii]|uniref:PHD-type domain-containing protein n=1 Tax=Chrysophaeum taylorii TaxID=2483200 RepID=A0AAD7UR10_9STRA|nr:hypothetical protein CTAYLR_004073 [Chrysophaeum taylorii]